MSDEQIGQHPETGIKRPVRIDLYHHRQAWLYDLAGDLCVRGLRQIVFDDLRGDGHCLPWYVRQEPLTAVQVETCADLGDADRRGVRGCDEDPEQGLHLPQRVPMARSAHGILDR